VRHDNCGDNCRERFIDDNDPAELGSARSSESAMNFITAIESARDAPFIARGFAGRGLSLPLPLSFSVLRQAHSIPHACPDRGSGNYRIPSFRIEFTRPTRNGIDLLPGTHPSLFKRLTINLRLPLQRAAAAFRVALNTSESRVSARETLSRSFSSLLAEDTCAEYRIVEKRSAYRRKESRFIINCDAYNLFTKSRTRRLRHDASDDCIRVQVR